MFENIRSQYERFPYPPIPFLALPRQGQGQALKYENAGNFLGRPLRSEGIRILVIGGGTLEPLIVSMAHPRAREIVNVDLSARSIEVLNRRIRFSSIARPFLRKAPVKSLNGDFEKLELGLFDYVIASNVLHHTEDPARALARASSLLKPGGILRMITYPKMSRIWMRATSQWLRQEQADRSPELKKSALSAVRKLPISHPIRACYESHQERTSEAGIIDAFFNACENPLSPLEWQTASESAGLLLIDEAQEKNSRSEIVSEFLGEKRRNKIDRWKKLQILDDTWELCANPILWFEKIREPIHSPQVRVPDLSIFEQIQEGANNANSLLQEADSDLEEWVQWLKKEVGPRTWPGRPDELLRGLSITEYFKSGSPFGDPDH